LHVPLTEKTRGFIGAEQLALLPEDAVLINTARGEVVDEAALILALRERRLYAAGLDTMAVEPLPASSELLGLDNVVLTPHVGGST
ncbi:NAD(P)-dependent oxidoreductase, partial [Klebsiella pneumoniae]